MSSYTDGCDEISGGVYGFYLLLTALLSSLPPAQKPVALKAHREEMRGKIAGQRGRYTLQCDVIKSDSFSGSQVRTASTYRQCSVT